MFSVIFEVHPAPSGWNSYLELAKMLRPELQRMDGFIDIVRYKSLTREGWILSLSDWRDEKALVRWRTRERHHDAQVISPAACDIERCNSARRISLTVPTAAFCKDRGASWSFVGLSSTRGRSHQGH